MNPQGKEDTVDQYGQQQQQPAPPPFTQPPGYPQPPFPGGPQKKGGAGMMIAGIAVGVVVCLAVVVGIVKFSPSSAFGGDGVPTSGPKLEKARATIQSLNSQSALYRLQHNDTPPDLGRYPNWEQFTQFTNNAGRPGPNKTMDLKYGPYLQYRPVNPFNELSNVVVMTGDLQPGMELPNGQSAGFVVEARTGRFWLTSRSGKKLVVP